MALNHQQFADYVNKFTKIEQEYEKFLYRFLKQIGMRTLAQTKKLTPVDSGDLRNRWELSEIYIEGDTLCIDMINSLDYASFVEDGHWQRSRWVPGQFINGKFVYQHYSRYGPNLNNIGGMMLKEKWIPGHYMARVSIAKVKKEIPKRFERAFLQFMKELT